MNGASLLKEIEKLRLKMYRLSKSRELNSEDMINCSRQLDQLLNIYQTKYAHQSYKNKKQEHRD